MAFVWIICRRTDVVVVTRGIVIRVDAKTTTIGRFTRYAPCCGEGIFRHTITATILSFGNLVGRSTPLCGGSRNLLGWLDSMQAYVYHQGLDTNVAQFAIAIQSTMGARPVAA